MKGSIVNQVEISGFSEQKEVEIFRKKIKSLKSVFNLHKLDKSLHFQTEEASWKMKDDFSLIYLFLTEDSYPEEEITNVSRLNNQLTIKHLIISPSGEGNMIYFKYEQGVLSDKREVKGSVAHMLGDLVNGGFQ